MNIVLMENIVTFFFQVLYVLVIVRAFLSWFPKAKGNYVDIIIKITDPLLNPIKHFIPPLGRVDFSPIILFIILQILKELIIIILYKIV